MPIIVARDGKGAQKVQESGVADEAYLQAFLAANPDSLPIEDIKDGARLMVLAREFPTASGPIDILAVDDDGELYVIETKLYKNPDKRLVIAQVLDYGAALWRGYDDPTEFVGTVDGIMARRGVASLSGVLEDFFGLADEEVASRLDGMKAHLRAGDFRFVILMDKLDARLKDLVLYMNERTDFHIYAVEMEFYRHEGLEIVIPKVFGAEVTKSTATPARKTRKWDETSFLADLTSRIGEAVGGVAKEIIHWVEPKVPRIQWGTGQVTGSFAPVLVVEGQQVRLFYLDTRGVFYIWPSLFVEKTSFGNDAFLEEFRARLNRVADMNLTMEEIRRGFTQERPLSIFAEPAAMAAFKEAVTWMIERFSAQSAPE